MLHRISGARVHILCERVNAYRNPVDTVVSCLNSFVQHSTEKRGTNPSVASLMNRPVRMVKV